MTGLKTIMAVEDEPDIRLVLEVALADVAGFDLTLCESGAQAVEVAPDVVPDLILLDVMMPGLDGPATLEALREIPATASTPVIFLTAKVQPQDIALFEELGALGVIRKPFDPMRLGAEVRALWDAR